MANSSLVARVVLAALSASALATLACGSSPDVPPLAAPLIGNYVMCTLTPNVTITSPIPATETTPITGVSGGISCLNATDCGLVLENEGGVDCSLIITANGDSATINPSHTCSATIMGLAGVITFTGGRAALIGGTLTAMGDVTISGSGDAAASIAGTGSLSASCTMQ